jgi:uncharacterized heparinase superfamily protein
MYDVRLALDTGRHMECSQIVARASRRLRYRFLYPWAATRLFEVDAEREDLLPAKSAVGLNEGAAASAVDRETLIAKASALAENQFEFLNLPPVVLPNPIDWRFAPDEDRLWQYNLHYGDWAIPLAHAYLLTGEQTYRDALIRHIGDWVDTNKVGEEPGWEPYPISRRLVAWSRASHALSGDPAWNRFWNERLGPSLRQQAKVLASNLETDLANNHLIANFRALAWVGLSFPHWPESSRLCRLGLEGLWSEMRRQVLADGVHDERSISYHGIVLQDLLETSWLALQCNVSLPDDLGPTLLKMARFLEATRAPDGSWPMVNDSVPGYPSGLELLTKAVRNVFDDGAPPPQVNDSYSALFTGGLRYSTGKPCAESVPRLSDDAGCVFPDAGYAVLRGDGGDFMVFDAGRLGPERMPGHGHADALSIVLYGKGRPMIVDPGVYSYSAGPWRDYFRSTIAHNTVTVDGQDQCVFWGPFRVAYPVEARILDYSPTHVEGLHSGYRRLLQPIEHRRRVELVDRGVWRIIDRFSGTGQHEFALTLQLAPGTEAEITAANSCVACWPDGSFLKIKPEYALKDASAGIENSWVSTNWNVKVSSVRYCLRWSSEAPVENVIVLTTG